LAPEGGVRRQPLGNPGLHSGYVIVRGWHVRHHDQEGDVSLAGLGQADNPIDRRIVGLLPTEDQ
jgi:hypothetical protein